MCRASPIFILLLLYFAYLPLVPCGPDTAVPLNDMQCGASGRKGESREALSPRVKFSMTSSVSAGRILWIYTYTMQRSTRCVPPRFRGALPAGCGGAPIGPLGLLLEKIAQMRDISQCYPCLLRASHGRLLDLMSSWRFYSLQVHSR